ncbi:MAG: hypothetical protein F4Z76_01605, partial [Rhodothermaceae bacterium]|nr:hypothetical protein [Rhodothermaceae bacterium]
MGAPFGLETSAWRDAIVPLLPPTAAAALVLWLVADPTYRFPLLTLLLPLHVHGAAAGLGVAAHGSKARWFFEAVGFAGFAAGWLLAFAAVAFGVAVALFSVPVTTALLRQTLFVGAAGLLLGAWFWWPWYVGDALAAWPRHGVRIATASGIRWDRLFLSWRMQRMAASGRLRWRGFGATGLVIGVVVASSAMGAYEGWPARIV